MDLISCILQVHPDIRYDSEDIKNHYWMKFAPEPLRYQPGIVIGKDSIPIEMEVVSGEMKEIGFKENKKVLQALLNNRHNQISTSYYLILKRRLHSFRYQ